MQENNKDKMKGGGGRNEHIKEERKTQRRQKEGRKRKRKWIGYLQYNVLKVRGMHFRVAIRIIKMYIYINI
jgi:hypothetical protein